MKKIIDGWKYDTETADLMFEILENNSHWFVYRNKKMAFFNHFIEMNKAGDILREDIRRMSKQDVITILITENYVDKYEEIFGEVPEAEGEDYISPEQEEFLAIENEVNHLLQTQAQEFSPNLYQKGGTICPTNKKTGFIASKTGFSRIASLQLIWACGCGDYDKAEKAIANGADCKYKNSRALCKAITMRSPGLIELLLAHGAALSDQNYYPFLLAISSLSAETVKNILKICENPLPESVITDAQQIAEKRKNQELIQLLNQYKNGGLIL